MLVVDKPQGLTSHDVVARVRRLTKTRRAGHTGTLDPLATGVLVVCMGRATRLIPYLEEEGEQPAKEYEAEIRFGFETSTDDGEGVATTPARDGGVEEATLRDGLARLVGEFDQTPPLYSARKVGGRRAYEIAREGGTAELRTARVQIAIADLLSLEADRAHVRFVCSRGTYIRALARDLGRALGPGAHLTALRRTRSGRVTIDVAEPLDDLTTDVIRDRVTPLARVLEDWPARPITAGEEGELRQGRSIPEGDVGRGTPRQRCIDEEGRLVALVSSRAGALYPFAVF